MKRWTPLARKGMGKERSEFSKLMRIYLYLRLCFDEPLETVTLKYAKLRSDASAWYKDHFGGRDDDTDTVFDRAVEVASSQLR